MTAFVQWAKPDEGIGRLKPVVHGRSCLRRPFRLYYCGASGVRVGYARLAGNKSELHQLNNDIFTA